MRGRGDRRGVALRADCDPSDETGEETGEGIIRWGSGWFRFTKRSDGAGQKLVSHLWCGIKTAPMPRAACPWGATAARTAKKSQKAGVASDMYILARTLLFEAAAEPRYATQGALQIQKLASPALGRQPRHATAANKLLKAAPPPKHHDRITGSSGIGRHRLPAADHARIEITR